jgi:sugar lactone lactonase YvrE
VAVLLSVGTSHAFAADPYVVYTANQQVNGAVILRSEPATGATVEISRNGPLGTLFQRPYDLAVEADGGLVVADMGTPDKNDGAVIRVDPVTGRQSLVSGRGVGGDNLYDPAGIAIGPGGVLYVLDTLAGTNSGAVIRVDANTGHQQVIASNLTLLNLFDLPFGIAVDTDGSIVVVNRALGGALPIDCLVPTGSVIRIYPDLHGESITTLDRLSRPLGVAIDTDRSILVANECGTPGGNGLVRVRNGLQSQAASNTDQDVLRTPERVALTPAGDYLVTDYNFGPDQDGGIVKVARGNQAQSVVSTDTLFNHPLGIAVVPNRPPTAALAISPKMVAAGQRVTLNASGSRDPEGLRLVYEWDLDGNGTFEAGSGTTPTAMPRFSGDGAKTVRVRVNDPHGGRAAAEATVDVDGSRPALTGLRALARVLGVPERGTRARRRAGAARAKPPPSTTVRFRLSEAATVTLAVNRARSGRRPKGKPCRARAKRGRPCTVWSRSRTVKRSLGAGGNGITVRARGLKPGRYRLVLTAADEVGNRSPRRAIGLRVVRLSR